VSASNTTIYTYIRDYLNTLFTHGDGSLGNSEYHSDIVQKLYNLTYNERDNDYKIADYVTVDMKGLYEFTAPNVQYTTIDLSILLNNVGIEYSVKLNGVEFSNVSGGSTTTVEADELATIIDASDDFSASNVAEVITITPTNGLPFTVDVSGTSRHDAITEVDSTVVNIPIKLLNNVDSLDMIKRGTVDIVKADGTIRTDIIKATIESGVNGNTYRITINGTDYDYVSATTNTTTIADGLATLITANANVTANNTANVITIDVVSTQTTFEVSKSGSTVLTDMTFDGHYDDGNGVICAGTIDYATGEVVLPNIPTGTYSMRFSQDKDNNMKANPRVVIGYSLPKVNYTDTTELISTLELE